MFVLNFVGSVSPIKKRCHTSFKACAQRSARFPESISSGPQSANTTNSNELLVKLLNQVGTTTSASKPSNLMDQNLLSLMEQKDAVLAELSGKINKTEKSAVDVSSTRNSAPLHRPPAVAVLNHSFSETLITRME